MSLRMPAAERREQLLAVALDVFAREGYHQTSMNDVAEAAGIEAGFVSTFRIKARVVLGSH